MASHQKTSTTRLPKELLEQLQSSSNSKGGAKGRRVPSRKERRKNERSENKQAKRRKVVSTSGVGRQKRPSLPWSDDDELSDGDFDDDTTLNPPPPKASKKGSHKVKESSPAPTAPPKKSILKKSKSETAEADKRFLRKAVKDKLAEDDAEIAALEKKLKIKEKKLPKAFIEDGLDFLLEGLDSIGDARGVKRKRAYLPEPESGSGTEDEETDGDDMGSDNQLIEGDVEDSEDSEEKEFRGFDDDLHTDGADENETSEDEDGEAEGDNESNEGKEGIKGKSAAKAADPNELDIYGRRKNAPTPSSGKYIPPSLRKAASGEDEELTRLRRQIQGQLNRLSEPTLLGIVNEMEQLYRSHPRNHVTSTLTDIIIASVCDRSTLLDTFMILHAGFIAALYKIIGVDFGAHITQRIVEEFDKSYERNKLEDVLNGGKECSNMISLLSELYNFQVVGCTLMFDFVRMFLGDITELNTELLLKLVRNCGPQLRSDDPTSLKDLVLMMQASVARKGEANLSVRTKFLIETITNLKNNRLKAAVANSVVLFESTTRMKKTLGSLNSRHLRASEPLRASLEDIRNVETKGRWWLVGASWRDNMAGESKPAPETGTQPIEKGYVVNTDFFGDGIDYHQLAREQRMNTDVRRAIFVTLMSSENYKDGFERLMRLRLKKVQQREIPQVLLHCCGMEESYNHYYTLVAQHLCSQHALKMAFQFCLWGLFRQMGEDDGSGKSEADDQDELSTRKIVSLAKLYGSLVGEGVLTLHILKTINLVYLQKKTKIFLEVFFVTIILKSQPGYEASKRDEKPLMQLFLKIVDSPALTQGVLYFLKKRISKTTAVAGPEEAAVVKWGTPVAIDALKAAAVAQATG